MNFAHMSTVSVTDKTFHRFQSANGCEKKQLTENSEEHKRLISCTCWNATIPMTDKSGQI